MSMAQNSMSRLERQADASRARLSGTLDELRYRMTPGELTSEALSYARANGFSLVRTVGNAVKSNPVPALLIGAGCAMLMRSRSTNGEAHGSHGSSMASRASGAFRSVGDSISSAASSVGESMSGGARRAREAAHDASDRVSEGYDSYSEDMSERAHSMSQYAREQGSRMGHQIDRGWSMLEEQPLIMAALGVAIGAALGAALPSTRLEDEYLGETSDHLKERATEFASDQYEDAKSAVKRTAEQVARDADEQGLSPEGVSAAAKETGDRVKNVASNAAEKMKSEAGIGSKPQTPEHPGGLSPNRRTQG